MWWKFTGAVVLVFFAMVGTGVTISAYAQSNALQIGTATFSVPNTNPAVTLNTPAKSGTLALLSDIPTSGPTPTPTASPQAEFRGTITLTNGVGSVNFISSVTNCVVSDPSGNSVKYARSATSLSVAGVGPTVDYNCK